MSEVHEQILDLEENIKIAKELIEKRKMAQKLYDNREFKVLFVDGYFLEDAARLVQMSTDPRASETIQKSCLEEARATGFMRRYLSDIIQAGAVSERDLPDMEATLEELRVEAGRE